jgi:ribosomal protein L7Ae-like RNA K-turn-binding protein
VHFQTQSEVRLSDTVERLLVRRCLELLGLARRAGEAVTGFEKVRALLTAGKVGFVFAARDAAHDGRRKISAIAPDVPSVDLFSSSELGGVFGRDAAIHVAVARGAIATKLLSECRRLAGFRMAETV